MKNFQTSKNNNKSFFNSRVFLVFLFLVFLFFIWQVFGFVQKALDVTKNKKIAEETHKDLLMQYDYLHNAIEHIKTEEGKIDFIKNNYGLTQEGEQMILIVDENQEENQNSVNSKTFNFWNIFNKEN